MTTIYDIAKAAGVTATTVSNVLSGKGSVGAATKARVLKYVQELDYQPNLIARSLIKGRTGVIGLVVGDMNNPFYAETTAAVERLAYTAGLRVFTTTFSGEDQVGQKLLEDLILRQVDGILVTSGSWSEQQTIRSVSAMQLPIVYCFWEGTQPTSLLSIALDFKQGGFLAGQHLLSLGHRRVGVITCFDSEGNDAHGIRVAGLQTALSQHGLLLDSTLLLNGQSSMEGGKVAAYKLLTHPDPPTAIFATTDAMAIGAMTAAWELGLQIPRDLSVVGLDDISLAKYVVPSLTTITIDRVAVLSHAIKLLLDSIDGQQVTSPPPFSVSLVIRGSTGRCP
ncbi:LacI family transcriptional regulator [Reticulibacter mediterranei]|uniref:LacI family transcriptional regulator n=1 Tax=Reticulibacter mediterranei TaxID=2778369 RepID=A0A8J3IR96_9CHLR|nr:LacI family DNA-binding transcriptional regulator [Reticulibacter mediterranei]GHO95445.1 LacI family transcriptional regulator [Reticulibacter mediterranei]